MEDVIELNGVRYVRESAHGDMRIVVLHRGHIVVGRYKESGDDVTITEASVIRIWGTTQGLGQIAKHGPTAKTVLDPCGTVRVHRLAIIMTLDCAEDKWTPKVS